MRSMLALVYAASLHSPSIPRPAHASRLSQPVQLAARRKAAELKSILEAAGTSTAGIVEKEELERLVDALEASEASKVIGDCFHVQT